MPNQNAPRPGDPYRQFRFVLELNALNVAGFSECTGLNIAVKTSTYHEGGRNDSTLIFPEMTSHGNITLKKGLTASNELLSWQMDVAKGEFEINPRSEVNQIAIVLQDANSKTVKRWELNRVLPVKWVGPDLKATTSEIAVESLELAYESLWLSELS